MAHKQGKATTNISHHIELSTMDSSAQVSLEYLLTVMFAVVLVIAATVLALQLTSVAQVAQTKILGYRDSTITSLVG